MKLKWKLTVVGLMLTLILVVTFAFTPREGKGKGAQSRLVMTPDGQFTLRPRDPTAWSVVATFDRTNAGASTNSGTRAR